MLFNSNAFVFGFLPVTLLLFHLAGRLGTRQAIVVLTLASFVFYAWDSLAALPILLLSIVFNFLTGSLICEGGSRRIRFLTPRVLVTAGIAANLCALGFYKYLNLLIELANAARGLAGWHPLAAVDVYLPTGISFFTFTQIAYLVDCYRHRVTDRSPADYALFVSFFPHLIAGPLLYHGNIIPQFRQFIRESLDTQKIAIGIATFAIGLSKKIFLADNLGYYVNAVYRTVEMGAEPMLFVAWVATLGYTFQLYFDFSGYSDMAIGLALLFGVVIPINFNSPYQATGIIEFWRRWHISLSNFLRDYLYIPLGGNRLGELRKYCNIFVTMLLGGLWHGASWTFALWGALHGTLLLLNHLSHRLWPRLVIPGPVAWLVTFACINLTWIVFRSPDLATAQRMTLGLFGLNGISVPEGMAALPLFQTLFPDAKYFGIWQGINGGIGTAGTIEIVGLIALCFVIAVFLPNTAQQLPVADRAAVVMRRLVRSRVAGILVGILFWLSVMNFSKPSPFLYFRF